jgi:hypothetical protein
MISNEGERSTTMPSRRSTMTTTGDSNRAALVVRAKYILRLCDRDELRDMLRRWIAGLPPEKVDAALVELFAEIDILEEVMMEHCGFRDPDPGEIPDECPF